MKRINVRSGDFIIGYGLSKGVSFYSLVTPLDPLLPVFNATLRLVGQVYSRESHE